MEFKAQSIADFLGGTVEGDTNATVTDVAKIEEGRPGTLAFLSNPKYNKYIYETEATIVIVNQDFEPEAEVKPTLIRVQDAYKAFASLLELYQQAKGNKTGIENPSFIDASAKVGNDVYIGAFAYIGKNVRIGNNVKIYPQVYIGDNSIVGDDSILFAGVKIYEDTRIGEACIIHAGAVIGSDGFGFAPDAGKWVKIPQIGRVIIGDDVEIGASTTVDRGALDDTLIGDGCKIDNQIQIGHNCVIGKHCVIAACAAIAGSVTLQDNVIVGGAAMIAGHVTIASGAVISGGSLVMKNITKPGQYTSVFPLEEHSHWLHNAAQIRHLAKLAERVSELEKTLKNINIKD